LLHEVEKRNSYRLALSPLGSTHVAKEGNDDENHTCPEETPVPSSVESTHQTRVRAVLNHRAYRKEKTWTLEMKKALSRELGASKNRQRKQLKKVFHSAKRTSTDTPKNLYERRQHRIMSPTRRCGLDKEALYGLAGDIVTTITPTPRLSQSLCS
jgi:hypothetical protein